MRASTRFALLIGWLGYALLPWYLPEGISLTQFGWLAGYPLGKAGSALALGITGQAPWLLPVGAALLGASLGVALKDHETGGKLLVWSGLAGLVLFFAQGFAVTLPGQGIGWLAALLGSRGAAQGGMGAGALLTILSLLLLFCHGLAYRGICRGDMFTMQLQWLR